MAPATAQGGVMNYDIPGVIVHVPCDFTFGHLNFDRCPECNEEPMLPPKGARTCDDLFRMEDWEVQIASALDGELNEKDIAELVRKLERTQQ
jgi:hypothetical protein